MTTITIKGTNYHTHDVLSCGDYSNNGMVGVSNLEVILEAHEGKVLDVWNDLSSQEEQDFDPTETEVILVRGNYSSKTIFLREDLYPAYETQLDNYPLLDEEDYSFREYEKAQEDWEDYGAKDFLTDLKKKAMDLHNNDPDLEIYLDQAYEPSTDDLWKLYNDNTNYGSCYEGACTHFYIEETIKEISGTDFFRDLLISAKEYSGKFLDLASDLEAILFE